MNVSKLSIALRSFNSIKVRLRHTLPTLMTPNYMFQFHKGSIKTPKTHELVGYITVSIP